MLSLQQLEKWYSFVSATTMLCAIYLFDWLHTTFFIRPFCCHAKKSNISISSTFQQSPSKLEQAPSPNKAEWILTSVMVLMSTLKSELKQELCRRQSCWNSNIKSNKKCPCQKISRPIRKESRSLPLCHCIHPNKSFNWFEDTPFVQHSRWPFYTYQ